jgi:polyhydroxyalkanoate synthesis regulator phasin
MSEDETKLMLETILKEMREGFTGSDRRLAAIEHQLEQMDIRLDRTEGLGLQARSEMMNLRADLKEFRSQFNEFRAQFKEPA